MKHISIVGLYWGAYARKDPSTLRRSWRQLLSWLEDGALTPLVSRTYPLDDAPQGIRAMMNRNVAGKIVVQIDEDV